MLVNDAYEITESYVVIGVKEACKQALHTGYSEIWSWMARGQTPIP